MVFKFETRNDTLAALELVKIALHDQYSSDESILSRVELLKAHEPEGSVDHIKLSTVHDVITSRNDRLKTVYGAFNKRLRQITGDSLH